jgi:hypothetical protein
MTQAEIDLCSAAACEKSDPLMKRAEFQLQNSKIDSSVALTLCSTARPSGFRAKTPRGDRSALARQIGGGFGPLSSRTQSQILLECACVCLSALGVCLFTLLEPLHLQYALLYDQSKKRASAVEP